MRVDKRKNTPSNRTDKRIKQDQLLPAFFEALQRIGKYPISPNPQDEFIN